MITPNHINEAQIIPLRQYVNAMVASKFSYNRNANFHHELKYAIMKAIVPILKKYGYIIQNDTEYDFTGIRDVDLDESMQLEMTRAITEDLRKRFDQDWVRFDTKGNIKGPCAREAGEGKPKCLPRAKAQSMSKKQRAKSARRKRRNDPVADRPGKGGKPINVKTELAEKLNLFLEKNVPNDPGKWSYAKSQAKEKYDVYPSAYANAWASKKYKELGGTWRKAK